MSKSAFPSFPTLVQAFFTEYLVEQRALSPRTVEAYRDAFALLLSFAERHLGKPPTSLQLADLDHALLAKFLDHLEQVRHNAVRTRNARLAAVRSFLKFAARRDVSALQPVERALSVPVKRFDRPMLGYLSREQMVAIIDAPPAATWLGRRDRLLLSLLYNTGARVSEIIGVRVRDVVLGSTSCVRLHGKGRKQRSVPLWKASAKQIQSWLQLNGQPSPESALIATRTRTAMTRANVAQRLQLAIKAATARHPELAKRTISPHTIRHTTAMHLLQSGVDISVIALWLGHESPSTTHLYVEADLAMKERALARLAAPDAKSTRFRPPDKLMQFLQAL